MIVNTGGGARPVHGRGLRAAPSQEADDKGRAVQGDEEADVLREAVREENSEAARGSEETAQGAEGNSSQADLVYDDRKPNHYNGDYVPSPHYKGRIA
jgi:hypothetical protein